MEATDETQYINILFHLVVVYGKISIFLMGNKLLDLAH